MPNYSIVPTFRAVRRLDARQPIHDLVGGGMRFVRSVDYCALGADGVREIAAVSTEQIKPSLSSDTQATPALIVLDNQTVAPLINWRAFFSERKHLAPMIIELYKSEGIVIFLVQDQTGCITIGLRSR